MADKRISDLDAVTSLTEDTIFHVRNTATNEDNKITKSNLRKDLGNSVIQGFTAISENFNKLTLTPSNNGILDQYYEGMVVQFISPIYSDDLVNIRIGNLPYVPLQSTFINPITSQIEPTILKAERFYKAIYREGVFVQVNIDRQYTNEYLASGEISYDPTSQENYTLYTLTSATSYYKEEYYEGMSIIFTSGIIPNSQENMSEGKIYVNVDNLGLKELSDPDEDGIPFSLQPNETIMGIYDGEKFIKNMFSMQEPDLPIPIDPDNPPPGYDITVYVGPDEPEASNKTLQKCFERIVQDYGSNGGGRKVLIKFRDNYSGEGLKLHVNTPGTYLNAPYITIEGNSNVTMNPVQGQISIFDIALSRELLPSLYINLTGNWKMNFPISTPNFSDAYCFIRTSVNYASQANIIIKDCIITNNNTGNQNYCFIYTNGGMTNISITNLEIKNFGELFLEHPSVDTYYSTVRAINFTITNTITQTRNFDYLLRTRNQYNFINLSLNISKPSNYKDIIFATYCYLSDSNIVISEPITGYILNYCTSTQINNCTIKFSNSVNNIKGSIYVSEEGRSGIFGYGATTINGNDFANPNSGAIPDIVVDKNTLYLKTGTLGSTQAINGGKIINV